MWVNYYSRTKGANTGQHGMQGRGREEAERRQRGGREDEEKLLIIVDPNKNF